MKQSGQVGISFDSLLYDDQGQIFPCVGSGDSDIVSLLFEFAVNYDDCH